MQVASLPAAMIDDEPLVAAWLGGAVVPEASHGGDYAIGSCHCRDHLGCHDVHTLMPAATTVAAITEAIGEHVWTIHWEGQRE